MPWTMNSASWVWIGLSLTGYFTIAFMSITSWSDVFWIDNIWASHPTRARIGRTVILPGSKYRQPVWTGLLVLPLTRWYVDVGPTYLR